MAYCYEDSLELAELSHKVNKTLMVGFNRRFAPMFSKLKEEPSPEIIVIEKNRLFTPGTPRFFIFDDFIHVIDTLRFLMGEDYSHMKVNGLVKDNKLHNVVLTLSNAKTTAIGIMNRDSGTTEETVEYMTSGKKLRIENLVLTKEYQGGREELKTFNDWDPTLYRRGFYQIVDEFIGSIEDGRKPSISIEDSLKSHELCESVVKELQKGIS